MGKELNVNPYTIYERRYRELEELVLTVLTENVPEEVMEQLMDTIDSVLDDVWNGQRTELFLQCLNVQLTSPEIKLNEAMEEIFKGDHSMVTMERPKPQYENPNPTPKPQPTSARKWMG